MRHLITNELFSVSGGDMSSLMEAATWTAEVLLNQAVGIAGAILGAGVAVHLPLEIDTKLLYSPYVKVHEVAGAVVGYFAARALYENYKWHQKLNNAQ